MKTLKHYKKLLIAGMCTVLVVLCFIFLTNSIRVYERAIGRTEKYLIDISYQINEKINTQINASIEMLRLLRKEALARIMSYGTDQLGQVLNDERYNELYLVDDIQQAQSWLSEQYGGSYRVDEETLSEKEAQLIAIPDESKVIYFVSDHADEYEHVIIGVKADEDLISLLNDTSFHEDAKSFAVTGDGVVITADHNQNFFEEIDHLRLENAEENTLNKFNQMESDIEKGIGGHFKFKTSQGEDMLLSYEPLDYSDWMMITILPGTALQTQSEQMSIYNLLLTFAVIAVLVGLFVILIHLQKRNTKNLEQLAFYDQVTGGMNITSFDMRASELLSQKKRKYSLISIDIRDFKIINNVYGIEEGNRTLRYIYETIQTILSDVECGARGSSDIFYILMEGQDRKEITERLQGLYHKVDSYIDYVDNAYYLELRFGIYLIENEDEDMSTIKENANMARKQYEQQSEKFIFYNQEYKWKQLYEKEVIAQAESALKNGEFQIYLQPKIDVKANRINGAEALVRWNHPKKGLVFPNDFIPIFEKYRFIGKLDKFVFEEVCKMLKQWEKEGRELVPVAVNFSKQNLEAAGFLDDLHDICKSYEISPEYLELELTETIFMENTEKMQNFLQHMHQFGFQCSLDDFGTGYSSLGILKDIDIDVIKLDRSFFLSKDNNLKGKIIIDNIIQLAKQLDILTVAEGIDNLEQVERLRKAGCDQIQGTFSISRCRLTNSSISCWNKSKTEQKCSVHLRVMSKMRLHFFFASEGSKEGFGKQKGLDSYGKMKCKTNLESGGVRRKRKCRKKYLI